jgi:hypothetical protein
MAIVLGIVSGTLTAWFLYKILFGSLAAFKESVEFWFQPDIVSALFSEYEKDFISELKIWLWSGGSIAVGTFVYSIFK